MSKLFFCCLMVAGSIGALRSLPIIVPSKGSLRLSESAMDFGDLKSWEDSHLLQNLPMFLDREEERDTDDIFSKEGFSLDAYNMDDSIKEELFDKHPRISLLSRLQPKDRKQYKKRAGNLSECFWKYCV
ncbi:PREDICTED: urotensin-2-like [Nanorana parkeri]|uniref:urotensin-2-like n=1 Tax=Nanorana parkeri TaxID=125878 RepID=UPI000854F92E|nr:PREDICTED: urotensin-2-like [Nanorana parkeri]